MNLIELFKNYLLSQKNKPSLVTVKNYLADIRKFISWYEHTFASLFNPTEVAIETIEEFRAAMLKTLSASSVERHISSLRKFFHFLKIEGIISQDPFEVMKTVSAEALAKADPWHVKEFKNFLYVYNASHLTIKNYIIDVKHFLLWVTTKLGTTEDQALSKITPQLFEEYKNDLLENQSFSATSINRKLSSLRKYLSWATEQGYTTIALSVAPKPKPVISSLPLEEILAKKDVTVTIKKPAVQANQATKAYSAFPPLRVFQKSLSALDFLLEKILVTPVASLLNSASYRIWKIQGKHIFFTKTRENSENILGQVRNIAKHIYAPEKISLDNYTWYQKIVFHARFTRPQWYKRYHTLPVVHYFNLAVLIIFCTAIGFGFYTAFIGGRQAKTPSFAASASPLRILSFQGRLTDNSDNPITTFRNLRFTIYDDPTASDSGGHRLWEEVDSVTPDQDGIFSLLLGSNGSGGNASLCNSGNPPSSPATGACGIPQSLFTNHATLYLGVTVENGTELAPRQQLATVPYASNAESLQGMLPTTDVNQTTNTNAILALNSSGTIAISGTATTTFQSAGGQLTIQGKTLVLNTPAGTNTNIVLAPDGSGFIDAQKPIQNSTQNNNIRSAGGQSTAAGAVEVDDLFGVLATSSGQSAFTVDQDGIGPIISASASGVAKFTVDSQGNGTFAGNVTGVNFSATNLGLSGNVTSNLLPNPSLTYSLGDASHQWLNLYAANIYTNGTSLSQLWQENLGALAPFNITDDLLLGATSTASAKFAFVNVVGSGTPTASISAGINGGIYITAQGKIATTADQNITIGDSTSTGNVILNPNGKVGILNSNPQTALDVTGSITANSQFLGPTGSSGVPTFSFTGNTNTGLFSPGTNVLGFSTNATERVRIDSTGNVSINTTSPLATFDVRGNSYTTPVASISGATGMAVLQLDQSGVGDFLTASNDGVMKLRITNQGFIYGSKFIDTDNALSQYFLDPAATGTSLTLAGSAGFGGQLSPRAEVDVNGSASVSANLTFYGGANRTHNLVIDDGGNLAFFTSVGGTAVSTPSLYIASGTGTNAGNVGIDTTSPTAAFDVNGSASVSSTLTFHSGSATIQATSNNPLTLGGNTTGNIVIGNNIASNLIPNTTDTYNLGNSSLEWNNLYVKNIISSGSTAGFWQRNLGALAPANITDDLLLGASSTSSATFGFINIASGTPTATISGNFSIKAPTGNAPANAINLLNNGSLGFYNSVGGDGGVGNPAIYIAKNGSVGIGTTASAYALNVSGTVDVTTAVRSNDFSNRTTVNNSELQLLTTGAQIDRNVADANPALIIQQINSSSTGDILDLKNNASTVLTVQQGGNVGIGTTTPISALQVVGSASVSANFAFYGTTTAHSVTINDGGNLGFYTSVGGTAVSTPSLYIASGTGSSAGNVGIGTTNPGKTLDISGTLRASGAVTFSTLNTDYGLVYTTSGTLGQTPAGSTGQCLVSNGGLSAPAWTNCASGGSVGGFWTLDTVKGALYPINSTVDLFIGGVSTTSAVFAVTGANLGTSPAASVSAIAGANAGKGIVINGDGSIQSLLIGQMTIGGSTTGDILLKPRNGSGTVSIQGTDLLATSGSFNLLNSTTTTIHFGEAATTVSIGAGSGTTTVNNTLTASGTINANGGTLATNQTTFNLVNGTATTINFGAGATAALNIGSSSVTVPINLEGNITLGNGPLGTNTITSNGFYNSDLVPSGNGSINLGSSAHYYGTLYVNSISVPVGNGINGFWNLTNNVLSPVAASMDLAVGGNATGSATPFQVFSQTVGGTAAVAGTATTSGNLTFRAGARTINAVDGASLNFETSVGGDSGLSSRLYIDNSGNIGIGGQTSPLATLDIAGSASVSGSLTYRGTATAHKITIDDGGTLGFYTSVGGTAVSTPSLYIASGTGSSAGNVGIETSTPKNALDVNGALAIGTYAGSQTAPSNSVIVSGNIGIGTTNPLTALQIAGTASVSANLALYGTGTAHTVNINDSGTLGFYTSVGGTAVSTPSLFIANGTSSNPGSVGIGTTNPSGQLLLYSSSTGGTQLKLQNADTGGRIYKFISSGSANTPGAGYFIINDETANQIRFEISPIGSVGIGTTTASLGNAQLVVNQTNTSGAGDIFTASSAGSTKFTIANDGTIKNSINPNLDSTYDLGTASLRWNNIYVNNLFTSGSAGTSGFWSLANNVIYPANTLNDLAVGGSSTASAAWQVFGSTVSSQYAVAGTATTSGNLAFRGSSTRVDLLNNANLGFYNSVGGNAGLNSTPALYIANSGNIGIGTTSPGTYLSFGNIFPTDKIYLYESGGNHYGFGINSSELNIFAGSGGNINLRTNGGTGGSIMYLTTGGNVGIGTTGPTAKLQIDATSGDTIDLTRNTSNNPSAADWIHWSSSWGPSSGGIRAGGSWSWDTQLYGDEGLSLNGNGFSGASPAIAITTAGNVGIGVTTPLANLDVAAGNDNANFGSGQTNAGLLVSNKSGHSGVINLTLASGGHGTSSTLGWDFNLIGVNTMYNNTTDALNRYSTNGGFEDTMAITMSSDLNRIGGNRMSFFTGSNGDPTERMSITTYGNVGIGTAATNPKGLLHVASSGSTDDLIVDQNSSSNLITMPSFENNTLSGWALATGSEYSIATNMAEFGQNSLKFTEASVGVNDYAASPCIANISPSTAYTLSAYIYRVSGYTGNTRIDMKEYDTLQHCTDQATPIATDSIASTTTTNAWTRISGSATTNGLTAYVRVRFVNDGSSVGTAYLDGFQLETGSTLSPYLDGSFGPGYYWTGTPASSSSQRVFGATFAKQTINSASGIGAASYQQFPTLQLEQDGTGDLIAASVSGVTKFKVTQGAGGGSYIYGGRFVDIDNSAGQYFLDPAATGTSLTVAGNVGIGTTSPTLAGLTVDTQVGNTDAIFGTTNASNFGVSIISNWPTIGFNNYYNGANIYESTNGAGTIGIDPSGNMMFATAPSGTAGTTATMTTRLYIAQGGNVGIGSTSPIGLLDVYTPSGNAASGTFHLSGGQNWGHTVDVVTNAANDDPSVMFSYRGGSKQWCIGGNGQNETKFGIAEDCGDGRYGTGGWGNERLTILAGGNVGIGTTGPNSLLSLGTAVTTIKVAAYDGGGSTMYGMGVNSGELTFGASIAVNGTPQMVLNSSGQVGIGTTGPSALLNVKSGTNGDSTGQPSGTFASIIYNANNSSGANGLFIKNNWRASTSTILEAGSDFVGGAYSSFFHIGGDGNVGIGTTGPNSALDVHASDWYNGLRDTFTGTTVGAGAGIYLDASSGTGGRKWAMISTAAQAGTGQGKIAWYDDTGTAYRMSLDSSGNLRTSGTMTPSTTPDIAENFQTNDLSVGAGDIISADTASAPTQEHIIKSSQPYDATALGIISTKPAILLRDNDPNSLNNLSSISQDDSSWKPVVLGGRVPTKVTSINGAIHIGDRITSSSFAGFGEKATQAGTVVATAVEDFNPNDAKCPTASSVNAIVWPADDGFNPTHPCYKLPDGTYVGKIMAFVKVSWYDPDVYITTTGDMQINTPATPSADFTVPSYYTLSDALGNPISRMGAFVELVVGNLRAGSITAQQTITNTLAVATENMSIGGKNIRDYIVSVVNDAISNGSIVQMLNGSNGSIVSPLASIDQVHTNIISPLSQTGNIALSLDDNSISVHSGTTSASPIVATIDNSGNASFSGSLNSKNLAVNSDATISGTLYAHKILADDIEGLAAKVGTLSAQNITNVTNIYFATPSATGQYAYNANSGSSVSSYSGTLTATGSANLASTTQPLTSGYVDVASYSGLLAYTPNLQAETAVFTQGLMSEGPTTLSDTTIAGQLAIGGQFILSGTSINVLGADLMLQPLRQGGVDIAQGAVKIDSDGNLTVNGTAVFNNTLTAKIISPIGDDDLVIKLGSSQTSSSNNNYSSSAARSSLQVQNASGSAIFKVTQIGDVIASGAASFAKLNLPFVKQAQALSSTEVVATGSAGMTTINAYQTEITIDNPLVTDKSLIYITPVGQTYGETPALLRQVPGVSFTVGIEQPITQDIKFNWLIIN